MKLTCDTKALANALKLAANVAPKGGIQPILACVLLEARGLLRVSAFDGATGLTQTLQIQDAKPGSVAVSAKRLADIVGSLPDGSTALDATKDGQLKIKSGAVTFKIACNAGDQYPALPQPSKDNADTLPADILSSTLGAVAYAMSDDESRPVLNTLQLSMGERIAVQATDGHRLAMAQTAGQGRDTLKTAILPRRGVLDLIRLVDSGAVTESWDVAIGDSVATFTGGTQTLTMSLVSGEYPDTARVVPPPSENPVAVERQALLDALKRTAFVSPGLVEFRLEENRLHVVATDADVGDATEALPVQYAGKQVRVGLNNKYMQQAIDAVDSERLILGIKDSLEPIRITVESSDSYLAVVMPMRLNK